MSATLFFIIACLAGLSFGSEATAQSRTRVVIGYSTMQAPNAPLWIAKEQGFFARYGIDAELVFLRSTSVLTAGMLSGNIDVDYSGGTGLISAAANGADLRAVASFGNRLTHVLVVRPGIKDPKELRGKRVGVVSIGGTQWITTKLGLQHVGVDEQQYNIQILAIGDQTILRKALEAGNIDAAFFNGVLAQELKQKGFPILAELFHAEIPTVRLGIVLRKAYLQQYSQRVENVLRALIEGLAFVLSAHNRPAVIKTIMHWLKISNPATVESGYPYLLQDLDLKLYPSVEGLRNLQRFMKSYNPRVADLQVEDLADHSLIRKLEESGFTNTIYGKYGLK
ncbi:MAG: ABC transporter substrate-binding protein [Deltaproteobacteria bacterium]|nr:ABC transporter substrate-binding protein [Deltaproteobacteria bacterium]